MLKTTQKILKTQNYDAFAVSDGENRPVEIKKRKRLLDSMLKYVFLQCYPIVVKKERNSNGKMVIKDGQHRFVIARKLQQPFWYVEDDANFDIAMINDTQKTWSLKNFAEKFAANGLKDYTEGIEFSKAHRLSLSISFALLAGMTNFGNVAAKFREGEFKIEDREWADKVASVYVPMIGVSKKLMGNRFIEACMAVCRVPKFDVRRLVRGAEKKGELIIAHATRDGFLVMMEELYNFNSRNGHVGLKAEAINAMRKRGVTNPEVNAVGRARSLESRKAKRQAADTNGKE